jgi:hypothetical protein
MAREMIPVDITHSPEVLRLAEEVRSSKTPRILRRSGEAIAVVMPLSPARKRTRKVKTKEDLEAFRAAAGGWKDFDLDKFLEDLYASRRASSRPPVEL